MNDKTDDTMILGACADSDHARCPKKNDDGEPCECKCHHATEATLQERLRRCSAYCRVGEHSWQCDERNEAADEIKRLRSAIRDTKELIDNGLDDAAGRLLDLALQVNA